MGEYEVTKVTSQPSTDSAVTVIAVIILGICFILIVGVIILYKKHKKSEQKRGKEKLEISLPTLGTQYELASLLSINTVGRESAEGSNQARDDLETREKAQDVFDGRVSQFIDASTVEMNRTEDYLADSENYTFENILDVTTDQMLGSSHSFYLKPPHADPENSTSRPMSVAGTPFIDGNQIFTTFRGESVSRPIAKILEEISGSNSSSTNPRVQLFPPSPSFMRQRPKSANIEQHPPPLPAKVIIPATHYSLPTQYSDHARRCT